MIIRIELLLILFLTTIMMGFAQNRKERETLARQEINAQLHGMLRGNYRAGKIIDVDSLIGDHRYNIYNLEDPYGTLARCFIFMASNENEYFLEGQSIVGVFKGGQIIWHSDTLIQGVCGHLLSTRDINKNGKVDIVTEWGDCGKGPGYVWIFEWDGNTGTQINATDSTGKSVLIGPSDAFRLYDAEGDGVWEIENSLAEEGMNTWSWNGTLYGHWQNTPSYSDSTLYPMNNVLVEISCKVNSSTNSYTYRYNVRSKTSSLQRIENFRISGQCEGTTGSTSELGWEYHYEVRYLSYGWNTNIMDNRGYLYPGMEKNGYLLNSSCPPTISRFYVQADNRALNFTKFSSTEFDRLVDSEAVYNAVVGYTIAPSDPPSPFNNLNFLDTLKSYTAQSRTLGWITNQSTADTYSALFDFAKTELQRNDNRSARSMLDVVMQHTVQDSRGVLSSEAFALIYFNTQYLLKQLPEIEKK